MRRMLALATVLLAVLCAQDTVFRTGVSLVRVDAQVTDGLRPIEHLQAADFEIKDNGETREALYCSQEDQAMDLLFLFDTSTSMEPAIRRIAASSHTALKELQPGDRVAVANFNTDAWLISGFQSDPKEIEDTVGRIVDVRFGGGTHILSSVYDAATYFAKSSGPHRRHGVLIFTDNDGQSSMRETKVVNHMWESDIVLCGLIIPTPGSERHAAYPSEWAAEGMISVAAKTGGETVNADDPGHAFREMLQRMRLRYSIYYQMPPAKAGATRQVAVSLSPAAKTRYPAAQVLARKGYIVPK
jgi:VWFA-related protein